MLKVDGPLLAEKLIPRMRDCLLGNCDMMFVKPFENCLRCEMSVCCL